MKEPKHKKMERNYCSIKNINYINNNKSMLELIPSRNLSYIMNNTKNSKNNLYHHNLSNKKKDKSKSFNITHNTINMNKNNVLINLNANIINTNTPIEKYKVQQKLLKYKRYLNKKINEISKTKKISKKNVYIPISNKTQIKINNNKKKDTLSTCVAHYKRINKFGNKGRGYEKERRKISPYQNAKNFKLNFNLNNSNKMIAIKNNNNSINSIEKRKNKILNLTKYNNNYFSNIVNPKNKISTTYNMQSRSSSNNSKSSLNLIKNKNKKKPQKNPTLKNFVFTKSGNI